MATALLSFENTPSDSRSDRSLRYMGGLMTIHADSQDTNGHRDDEELILHPGESGFLPRNVPHTFKVMSSHARALIYVSPGGFEGYFWEIGEPAVGPASPKLKALPTPAEISSVAKRYGITFLL